MHAYFFYGPDKLPFSLDHAQRIISDSAIPFHGIISRGLLNRFIADNLSIEQWYQNAHWLFDDEADPVIAAHARECGVLSFGRSAFCAHAYSMHYCEQQNIDDAAIELWNIKEGHTSSVWRISISSEKKTERFALNVARDTEAGIELKESSQKLKAIGEAFPGLNLAKVLDIHGLHHASLPDEIVVTRNEWVDDSFEIHPRINKDSGNRELLMVERFLAGKDNPAQIYSVAGRKFTSGEVNKIETDLQEFLSAAESLPGTTQINVADGDLVWNGEKAIVVAIS